VSVVGVNEYSYINFTAVKTPLFLSILLLTYSLAQGMGYPQDMFAEHVTVKSAEKKTVDKSVKTRPAKATPSKKCTTSPGGQQKTGKYDQVAPLSPTRIICQPSFICTTSRQSTYPVKNQPLKPDAVLNKPSEPMSFTRMIACLRERLSPFFSV
jgi:hypothetical protein